MSEYDLYILRDSMRCWKIAIKGMKYKDFRIYYYPYNPESRFIRIYLSRYLFIDIDYDDFTLSSIGYF